MILIIKAYPYFKSKSSEIGILGRYKPNSIDQIWSLESFTQKMKNCTLINFLGITLCLLNLESEIPTLWIFLIFPLRLNSFFENIKGVNFTNSAFNLISWANNIRYVLQTTPPYWIKKFDSCCSFDYFQR